MPEKDHLPLPVPTKTFPVTETLSDAQEGMYKNVLAHFSKPEYGLPKTEDGALMEEEKFWLSHECLLRYLRASKWVEATAINRLEDTLKWRRDYGLYTTITPDHVRNEGLTGKCIIFGYDVDGRPGLYLLPSRQNTQENPIQVEFTVFMLERCMDAMAPGVENLVLLIDYADKAKNPSLTQARTVLNIIQTHYPERLGRAMILNVPFLLRTFYTLITPFIDPVTRTKLKFNPRAVEEGMFAKDQIMVSWGGERDMEWDHDQYWPALLKLCEDNKTKWMVKWKELGGTVGLKEWDYKA